MQKSTQEATKLVTLVQKMAENVPSESSPLKTFLQIKEEACSVWSVWAEHLIAELNIVGSQQTHNVVITSLRRCNDIIASLCVCWVRAKLRPLTEFALSDD